MHNVEGPLGGIPTHKKRPKAASICLFLIPVGCHMNATDWIHTFNLKPLKWPKMTRKCYLSTVHFPFMETALASKQISWIDLSVISRCCLMYWFCFYSPFFSSLFPVSSSMFQTGQTVAFTIRTHTYCVPRAKLKVDIISSELIVRQHWFSC